MISLTLISTVIVAYSMLWSSFSPVVALVCACFIESVAFFIRLWYARRLNNIPTWGYIRQVLLPVLSLTLVTGIGLYLCKQVVAPSFLRLILIGLLDVVVFIPITYFVVLGNEERNYFKFLFHKLLKR